MFLISSPSLVGGDVAVNGRIVLLGGTEDGTDMLLFDPSSGISFSR